MVRFGIVGVGRTVAIARQHADALNKLPQVRITALYSRTKSRAEEFARDHCPLAVVCDSFEQLLEQVDCVCICSPNCTHAFYALQALAARKGVLCEKPLGGSREELEELARVSRACGVTNMVAYNFRYQAAFLQLRRLVQEGIFGKLYWYQEQKGGNRLANANVSYEWRMDKASGGGSTMDFCSHMLDHYLFVSGESAADLHLEDSQCSVMIPVRPDGKGSRRAVETEDFTHLRLTGRDGTQILLTASRVGMPGDRAELAGEKAMALWNGLEPDVLLLWQKDETGALAAEPQRISCDDVLQQTYDRQDAAFVAAFQAGKAIQPDLAEGCQLLHILTVAIS